MTTKIPMISTGAHRYEGRNLINGDPFEANNEIDADELKILGFAKRVPAAQTYETRVMVAADPASPAHVSAATETIGSPPPAERQKRAYNRRNLAAE